MFRPTFRLGRIVGAEVGVHWSVPIIFGLLAWSLSGGRFPAAYPDNPAWAYLLAGFGAAVVFFLGLLAHEVSHAVMAMRNGCRWRASRCGCSVVWRASAGRPVRRVQTCGSPVRGRWCAC